MDADSAKTTNRRTRFIIREYTSRERALTPEVDGRVVEIAVLILLTSDF